MDALSAGKYDTDRNNLGAWVLEIVKNNTINILKKEFTKMVVQEPSQLENILQNMLDAKGKIYIQSRLDPDEIKNREDYAFSNVDFDDKYTYYKNGKEKFYFTYVYNTVADALWDFGRVQKTTSNKQS